MKKIFILFVISFFACSTAFTQNLSADSIEISRIIYEVFDGMRESDTTKMTPYFHPEVKMQSLSVGEDDNQLSPLNGSSGWLNAVANNSGDIWDEQISNLRIQSDGAVATAWMNYEFYLGDKLRHCGINSFQFIKTDEKWKIIYIIDSRIKNCQN